MAARTTRPGRRGLMMQDALAAAPGPTAGSIPGTIHTTTSVNAIWQTVRNISYLACDGNKTRAFTLPLH